MKTRNLLSGVLLFAISFCFTLIHQTSQAQPCQATIDWQGTTLTGINEVLTMSTGNLIGDYSEVLNAVDGDQYTFVSTDNSGTDPIYITVRSGTFDGPVIDSGFSPLTVIGDINGAIFPNYSADELCDFTSIGTFTSTVQCISCPVFCPDLGVLEGTPCDDGDPDTNFDRITEDCECAGNLPCTGNFQFSSATLPFSDEVIQVSTCNLMGDYTPISDAVEGNQYTFTSTDNDNADPVYITVRSGSFNGTVLGAGYSPLTVTSDIDGTLYPTFNSNEFCELESIGCFTTSVQCITCPVYCEELDMVEGDACDDGDPNTLNDILYSDCICRGTPPNDNCGSAAVAECGGSYSGNTFGSTSVEGQVYCNTSVPSPLNGGVWYSLDIAGTNDVDIDLSGSLYDTKIFLYSGACGALVCVDGDDDGGTGLDSRIQTTLGTGSYSIYITGFSANRGDYVMNINCVPVNDLCENSILLNVNLPEDCVGNETVGTTSGATASNPDACESTSPDVYFSFNSGPNSEVLINLANIGATDLVLSVFEGSCESTAFFCEVGNNQSPLIAVSPSTTYYVRVHSFSATFSGSFSICVEETYDCPLLSANIGDACNDGNPNTNFDMVNAACECAGNLPCLTSSLFSTETLNGTDEILSQSSCNFLSEYNQILNALDGDDYTFTAEDSEGGLGYITIRSGSLDGPVLGSGYSPVTVTSDIDGALYAHYTLNEFCEESVGLCNATTVQCITCDYDCPSIGADIGDACDDGNPSTTGEVINDACECAVPSLATISGTVNWNSNCGDRELAIGFFQTGTDILLAVVEGFLNADGTYSLAGFPTGTFDVYVILEGHLSKGYPNQIISAGVNTANLGSFIAGDINGSNGVNISDFSLLNVAFGSSDGDSNYNYLADFNCDGNVNIFDVSILNIGFGMVGQVPD